MIEIFLSEAFWIGLVAATLELATPIALAALGEIFAERSGVINLGVEGIMLIGAIIAFVGAYYTNNVWVGALMGAGIGAILGLLMAVLSVSLRVDQVISGLGIYFVGWGLSSFLYRQAFGVTQTPPSVQGIEEFKIPFLGQIPIVGPTLFQHNPLVYFSWVLIPLSAFILFKTTFGLKLRAVGENPKAADALGVKVYEMRYICVIIGGILAGLAGAYLSVAELKMFREDITVGRGFIAVAIVYFGKWAPLRTYVGALLFGGAYAFQIRLQALGVPIPHQFLLMLPYVLTIATLVGVSRKARGPASVGIPYKRA